MTLIKGAMIGMTTDNIIMITIKDEINLKKSIYGLHHNIGDLN
jgi:hypothetical protein